MDNNSTLSAEKMVGQGISPKQKKEALPPNYCGER